MPHATLLDVNVDVVAKHYPTLLDEFKFKLAQNLKAKRPKTSSEDVLGRKGRIQTRKNQRMIKRTCRKGYILCKIHSRLGNDDY